MATLEQIKAKLSSCSVDAIIMYHTLTSKKLAHIVCIEALKNIDGDFYGFLGAYNDGMDALCEVQDFLEPVKMKEQAQLFFSAFNGAWDLITPKMRDEFIAEHQAIVDSIDGILRQHKF
jgi:hypothetical protein